MDGRQAGCYSAGSESEVRERESGELTRVELNKAEEMMAIIVSAVPVRYLSPVCLLVIWVSEPPLDRFRRKDGSRAEEEWISFWYG